MSRRVGTAVLAALAAAGVTWVAMRPSLRLEPETATWRRSLRGVTAKGVLSERGGLLLPDLARGRALELLIDVEPAARGARALGVRLDGGPATSLAVGSGAAQRLTVPPAPSSGLRIDFAAEGGALRLRAVELLGAQPPLTPPLGAALAAGLLAGWSARRRHAAGVALVAGALIAAASWFPLGAWLWPQAFPALLPALLAGTLGAAFAWRAGRRAALSELALVTALVFGSAVRLLFLHSTGSWDTEYWKTWMHVSLERGVTGAYGPAEALPPGHAPAQLRGQEALWKPVRGGREFVIDYPPLAMALWVASAHAVAWVMPALPPFERDNVAVKLPALLGDVLSLPVLLWAFRPDRRRALTAAALYWAAPVSWLSSATLGYFDGVLPPLLVVALVLAGRGRAGWSGAWLALAALIKPTALIAAPALAAALVLGARGTARAGAAAASLARATAGGLAVSALVSVPYAWAGTLTTAVVHCARLFFQERLSGGYPNLWWLLGHWLTARDSGAWLGPVAFAPIALLPFPARPLGTLLFALGAWHVVRRQPAGPRAACLAGALLFLLYGMVGVGVHENHPHPLFLMLLAAGLPTRRLRWVALGAAVVYVGDMLALSGLGRYHGSRYVWLLPWAEAAGTWRMGAGIDLTLPLTLIHVAVCAAALAPFGRRQACATAEEDA